MGVQGHAPLIVGNLQGLQTVVDHLIIVLRAVDVVLHALVAVAEVDTGEDDIHVVEAIVEIEGIAADTHEVEARASADIDDIAEAKVPSNRINAEVQADHHHVHYPLLLVELSKGGKRSD